MLIHTRKKALAQGPIPLMRHRIDLIRRLVPVRGWRLPRKEEFDFTQAEQGTLVPTAPAKTRITIRLNTDALNWFRNQVHEASGGNYQTLINEALRQYIQVQDSVLEETLCKVIREELQTLYQ